MRMKTMKNKAINKVWEDFRNNMEDGEEILSYYTRF